MRKLEDLAAIVAAGAPVVLPFPTPLPYVVAGLDPAAVNEAKGRPADQPVGLLLPDLDRVADHIDLAAEGLAFAAWLSTHERLNLFVPARDPMPDRLRPSTSDGWLAITLAVLDEVRPLLEYHSRLCLSSANRTGGPVATTAESADVAFGGALPVLDGAAARDPSRPSGSATIVRVGPARRLEIVRNGIQTAHHPGTLDDYLADLTRRYAG